MSLATDKVLAALSALGETASYQDANRWIEKNYGRGQGVSDALFYNTRKELRAGKRKLPAKSEENPGNDRVSDVVSAGAQLTQSQAAPEFTLAELREIAGFVRKVGGKARLMSALGALEELVV